MTESLLSREAYREAMRPMPLQWAACAGLCFATLLAGAAVVAVRRLAPAVLAQPGLRAALVLGFVVASLGFGLLLRSTLHRRFLALADAIHDGRAPWDTAAPAAVYTHRIPATLLRGRIGIGGVLYLGAGRVAFVPHRRNLPRHRGVVTMADGRGCSIEAASTGTLRFASGLGEWVAVVPRLDLVAARIATLAEAPASESV